MKSTYIKSLIMLILTAFCIYTYAISPADELENIMGSMHSMQANFVEQVINKKAKEDQPEAKGKMALHRPGKFRWEVKDPENRIILADGTYLWIYDIDLAQATKKKISLKNMGTPALLLSGSIGDIKKHFTVRKDDGDDNDITFKLIPKSDDSYYQWIKLHFIDDKLVSMQIETGNKQRHVIDFSDIKINSELKPSVFKLELSDDVDIIND